MASETVKDIIMRVRGLHNQLSCFYEAIGDSASKQRVKLLLQYVSRHERNLETALRQYQEQADRSVLNTWYKASPGNEIAKEISDLKITPEMTTEEVISLVLAADRKLVNQFRQLSENAASEDVRELFQKLIAIEEREEHQLVRDSEALEDI